MKTSHYTWQQRVTLVAMICFATSAFLANPTQAQETATAAQPNVNAGRGYSEVNVTCVYFVTDKHGRPKGGTSPVSIRVFPNYSKTASVGVMEEFYGGTGEMWRTAAWIAAFNAARVNDTTIIDHEFIVKVGGHIDGPSAGMLTTVAMLASMRGESVKTDATMTGTINPDGTAGSVGGIPQKMEGAQKAGFKRFGYPVGCRSSVDMETNENVDVNARADDLGMEATEIRDVYEAYEFMTGVKLKRPTAASESDMDLSTSLRTKISGWSLRTRIQLEQRYAEINAASKQNELVDKMLSTMLGKLQASYAEAETFEQSSLAVAAYYRYMECDALARALDAMIDVIPAVATGKPELLSKHLMAVNQVTLKKLKAFRLQARGSLKNKRLGGRIDAINNMNQYAQGFAYYRMAADAHNEFVGIQKNMEKFKEQGAEQAATERMTLKFVFACLFYEMAGISAEYAEDWLSIDSNLGEEVVIEPERYEAIAQAYASAGASCLSYFNALVIKPKADSAGVSTSAMQERMSDSDTMYPFAAALATHSERGFILFDTKNRLETALFKLGGGAEAYLSSTGIVNKYYSLRAEAQQDGSIRIKNKKVIGAMLQNARQRVLEEAGNLKEKHGFIPDSVKVNFQLATALREGTDDDKLNALGAYWRAAYLCDIATTMTSKSPELPDLP